MSIVRTRVTEPSSMTDIRFAFSSAEYALRVPRGTVTPIGLSPTDTIPRSSPERESIAATVLCPPIVRSVTQIVPAGTP
jgi:hypothetical protein